MGSELRGPKDLQYEIFEHFGNDEFTVAELMALPVVRENFNKRGSPISRKPGLISEWLRLLMRRKKIRRLKSGKYRLIVKMTRRALPPEPVVKAKVPSVSATKPARASSSKMAPGVHVSPIPLESKARKQSVRKGPKRPRGKGPRLDRDARAKSLLLQLIRERLADKETFTFEHVRQLPRLRKVLGAKNNMFRLRELFNAIVAEGDAIQQVGEWSYTLMADTSPEDRSG